MDRSHAFGEGLQQMGGAFLEEWGGLRAWRRSLRREEYRWGAGGAVIVEGRETRPVCYVDTGHA